MKLLHRLTALLLVLAVAPATAAVQVFACEPEWAALAAELGGERVSVFGATTAQQDPHRIEARPSLIARMRRADLVVCTGAELEAGWLPMLLRQAGNDRIRPGTPGYLEAAMQVERLDVPASVDRAEGDVHAAGNPHIHLDPHRLATVAGELSVRLAQVEPAGAERYRQLGEAFQQRWAAAIARWEAAAAPLHGRRFVVHHKDLVYLFHWLGLVEAGALEPKPGLPPSAGHLAQLKASVQAEPVAAVLRSAYQDERPARWLSQQTGVPALELPYTVGGAPGADDLFGLYEVTLNRLLALVRQTTRPGE